MQEGQVGFDIRMWSHPGIGRYIRELTREFVKAPSRGITFFGPRELRNNILFEDTNGINTLFRTADSNIYGLHEQWQIWAASNDMELLHVPHFNVPLMRRGKIVTTIHDLIYLREPLSAGPIGRAYVKMLMKHACQYSKAILTVSEYTKNDILNFFPKLSQDHVIVTHEAASTCFDRVTSDDELKAFKKKMNLDRPYVLFVGSLKPHKNVSALTEAMQELKASKNIPHELILVGKIDPKHRDLYNNLRSKNFVRHFSEVDDEALMFFYKAAEVFLLPSFREGFGLPVLEAMRCGTPVLCSDAASLPEVGGAAARYFNPTQIDELCEVLYNILRDNELRKKMSVDGLAQAKKFSWEATARQTLAVYQKVLA